MRRGLLRGSELVGVCQGRRANRTLAKNMWGVENDASCDGNLQQLNAAATHRRYIRRHYIHRQTVQEVASEQRQGENTYGDHLNRGLGAAFRGSAA